MVFKWFFKWFLNGRVYVLLIVTSRTSTRGSGKNYRRSPPTTSPRHSRAHPNRRRRMGPNGRRRMGTTAALATFLASNLAAAAAGSLAYNLAVSSEAHTAAPVHNAPAKPPARRAC